MAGECEHGAESHGVLAGWTAGREPWLRRRSWSGVRDGRDLEGLAAGRQVAFGSPVSEPVFLVCAHAQRNACPAQQAEHEALTRTGSLRVAALA